MSYRQQQAMLDQMNFYGDPRVIADMEDKPKLSEDERFMVYTLWGTDDEGEEFSEEVQVPTRFDVCPTCKGHGRHVNPAIDCGGISAEEFHRDPHFARDYARGAFDVTCGGCKGKRVVPVADLSRVDDETAQRIRDWHREAVENAEEYARQLRYGY